MTIELQTPDFGPKIPRDVVVPAELHEIIAFHCVAMHCNTAAMENSALDNLQYHLDEHFGCGGIRNHSWLSFGFDPERLEEILEEAEDGNYGFTRGTLPNGMPKDHFWFLNECGNVPRIGNH